MFLREPFLNHSPPIENLNLDSYLHKSLNDKNYIKLVRELLLKIREKRNKVIKHKVHSFPVGSVVLVKDLRPKAQKKLKPIFFKLPQKVISEYHSMVYAMDFLGKVRKHSKNNIRMAHPRSEYLFSKLPDEIKLILGDVFDGEVWEKIKNTKHLPEYLSDIEIEDTIGREMRSARELPVDTHLLETSMVRDKLDSSKTRNDDKSRDVDNDEELMEELVNNESLGVLNLLHTNELLNGPNIRLQDVPIIMRHNPDLNIENVEVPQYSYSLENDMDNLLETEQMAEKIPAAPVAQSDFAAVNPDNILPVRTRSQRRRVRFNLPT